MFFASSSPSATRIDSSASSSGLSKLIRPISFRYILTGSLMLMSLVKSSSVSNSTSSSLTFSGPAVSPPLFSSPDTTVMPFSIKRLYNSSNASLSISNPFKASASCSNVINPSFLPNTSNSSFLSSNVLTSLIFFIIFTPSFYFDY